jgi:hypothetical protein
MENVILFRISIFPIRLQKQKNLTLTIFPFSSRSRFFFAFIIVYYTVLDTSVVEPEPQLFALAKPER